MISKNLILDIGIGLVVTINIIITSLSASALIFSGLVQNYVANGFLIFLLASTLASLSMFFFSKLFFSINTSPSQVIAIFAVLSASISLTMMTKVGAQGTIYLIFFVIAMATILTGLLFFFLGYFNLGKIIRYIPYPVSSSFLAGTGWIIFKDSFNMLLGKDITFEFLSKFISFKQSMLLIINLFLGTLIYYVVKKFKNPIILPACVLLLILSFYIFLGLNHISLAQATHWGLMLPAQSLSQINFHNLNWIHSILLPSTISNYHLLLNFYPLILIIILISAIALLFNLTSIELFNNQEINLNKEVQLVGLNNIVIGGLGGFLSIPSLSNTVLAKKSGGQTRLTSIVVIICILAFCFIGIPYVTYFPKIILSAILVYLGIHLIFEFLLSNSRKLPLYEYCLSLVILSIIIFFGIIPGIIIGTILAAVVFVYNYSRINVVKYSLRGNALQSNTQRSYAEQRYLNKLRKQIIYFNLHGYIFFGSANNLFEQIKVYFERQKEEPFRYLILDFKAVSGIDSSAISYLLRITQHCIFHKVSLIFTHLSQNFYNLLLKWDILKIEGSYIKIFNNNDMALEWCENKILEYAPENYFSKENVKDYLKKYISNDEDINKFINYMQRLILKKDNYLFCQDDIGDSLYFIDSGEVIITISKTNEEIEQLRKIGPVNIIGEMGFYTQKKRVASAIATKDSSIYKLTASAFEKMRRENSNLATALDLLVIAVLSNRIKYLDTQVKSLF